MPSSTSSSEAMHLTGNSKADYRASHRSIGLILAGICLIGIAAEAVIFFALPRLSKIEHRIEEEYRGALALPSYAATGSPAMLLVGNSLLLEGVDLNSLRTSVSGEYDVHRLCIEQTEFLDLYYLLRKLFRDGSRPHDVVLCLSVAHLIGNNNRGEFMASFMDAIDLAALNQIG